MRQPDHEYEERSFGDIQRAIDFENSMNDLESQYQKDQLTSWTRTKERAILRMAVVFGAIHEPRPTVL